MPAPENAPKLLSEDIMTKRDPRLMQHDDLECMRRLTATNLKFQPKAIAELIGHIDAITELRQKEACHAVGRKVQCDALIEAAAARERQYAELVAAAEPLLKALEAEELLTVEPWEECLPMNCACVVPANVIRRAADALAALSPVSPPAGEGS